MVHEVDAPDQRPAEETPGNGSEPEAVAAVGSPARDYNLARQVYDRGGRNAPARPRTNGRANGNGRSIGGANGEANGGSNGDARPFNLARLMYAPVAAPPRPAIAPAPATDLADGAEPPSGAPTVVEVDEERRGFRTFESLRVRDFRWFFAALLGHFTSMNMQMFIGGWMVFQLTGSYTLLGGIALASAGPQFAFALVGGVLADIVPQKKWIVQLGQLANSLNALVIGLLVLTDQIIVEHLLIAAAVQGTSMALMMPARQAMTPEIVGQERLMNAMALTTAGMNGARLVMPGFAGWLVAAVGGGQGVEGAQYVYFMMAGLYLWATLLLGRVSNRPRSFVRQGRTNPIRDIADAVRYLRGNREVRTILGVNLVLEVVAMPYFFLLPGFVADVLDGGAFEVGTLMSISGIGALVGSLLIASLPNRKRSLIMLASTFVLGVSLLAFSASTVYLLSAALFIGVGFGQTARFSLSGVLVHAYTNDEFRGRVAAVYNLSWGVTNFSAFFVGLLADRIGPQMAIGGTAAALIVLVVLFALTPYVRNLD